MCKGFVKIPRRLFETKWWHQKRIYSESDAIIDLYQSADRKYMLTVSVRSLAGKWLWEQTKVLRFLAKLASDGYIETSKNHAGTVIKILDFGQGATPSATPTATLSRAYKNDIIISSLNGDNGELENNNPHNPPRGRFVKPTIEEIRDYCNEKGYDIDAEHFWNYYESKGWVIGKSPMKNWKSACTNWTKSRFRNGDKEQTTQLKDNSPDKFKKGFSW